MPIICKNPQRISFLNAKLTGDVTSPGVGTDYVYRDPWGNPYIITLDANYDAARAQDVFMLPARLVSDKAWLWPIESMALISADAT